MSGFTGLSFIICHREEEDIFPTIASIQDSFAKIKVANFNSTNYEILTVRGNHPSLQRNVAVDEATYSHIYFLDNDSILGPVSLEHLVSLLVSSKGEEVSVIGGPSLLPGSANDFEVNVDGILTAYHAIGSRASRYSQIGKQRYTDGMELILCNMVVDKKRFIEYGRFDYRLYPNEENEFMNRVYMNGGDILYSPNLSIHRHQRENYPAFFRQMFNYGRGKAEELKVKLGKLQLWGLRLISLVCWVFITFLLGLLLSGVESAFHDQVNSNFFFENQDRNFLTHSFLGLLPHLAFWYGVYLIWIAIRASIRKKRMLYQVPILLVIGHITFGLAFNCHLFMRRFRSEEKVFWFKITIQTAYK